MSRQGPYPQRSPGLARGAPRPPRADRRCPGPRARRPWRFRWQDSGSSPPDGARAASAAAFAHLSRGQDSLRRPPGRPEARHGNRPSSLRAGADGSAWRRAGSGQSTREKNALRAAGGSGVVSSSDASPPAAGESRSSFAVSSLLWTSPASRGTRNPVRYQREGA